MSNANNPINQAISTSTEVNKLALVVGVNNSSIAPPYRPTLKYAEKDAEDMASLLNQPACSFTLLVPTLTGEHATSGTIKQRVIELVRKRGKEDFLLFYYAGHAVPIENDIYFITHDFQEEHVEFDPDLYLSMRWLWKVLYQSAGAGRVLLILDCCYAGNMVEAKEDPLKIDLRKLLDEWNTGTNGKEPKNCLRLVLTATGYNNPAQEQDGHGLMTGYLLQALRGQADEALDKEGHVDIRYLHKYLQEKMPKEQAPDLSGKFGPHHCILASYPERAAQRRSQHRPVRGAERPHSYIPFLRNPLFQPRPGEFERLETLLSGENAEQPARIGLAGVTGMGGIGKTQLAVELAYRLQEQHRFPGGIFWTPATGKNVFEWQSSMAVLAFNADYLPPDDDPSSPENEAHRARHLCRYLASHSDALLILDNVEDPKVVIEVLPSLAGGEVRCSILYTSRITSAPTGAITHTVEYLSEEAALNVLLKTNKSNRDILLKETLEGSQDEEACAARCICKLVGYLPLALALLRNNLEEDLEVPLIRLLAVLQERGALGVAEALVEVFRLSWELVVLDEDACRLFQLAAYFPEAAPIPLWLLGIASGLGEQGDFFEPLGRARLKLHKLSLLEKLSGDQVRLHPLLREFGQQLVKEMEDKGTALREEAGQRLVEAGTDLNWLEGQARKQGYRTCLEHVREMLAYVELLNTEKRVKSIRRIERCLDRESYLLSHERWWPNKLPGLFYQQVHNRAIEMGQPVKAKSALFRWLRQTKQVGIENQSLLRILAGHTDWVTSVAFSPDGKQVLTGSWDKTATVWDLSSGKEQIRLEGHTGGVTSVAFSPNGKQVLTGSFDKTARVWNLSSGKEQIRLEGHIGGVTSVAFSPDGKQVLTGSFDKIARMWDVSSSKEQIRLEGHTGEVNSVAFSPDGKKVVTGSSDKTARVWELSSGKELIQLKGHRYRVGSVAFSPNGRQVVTGSIDKTARVWDLSSGKELTRLQGHTSLVSSVAFSPDGKQVLTGSFDQTTRLWELSSGKEQVKLEGHAGVINSVAFLPDGKQVVTGSSDKTATVWDLSSSKEQVKLEEQTDKRNNVAFSPDGKQVLTGSSDKTATVWELSSSKELTRFQSHTDRVSSVAFSPDGRQVLTGSWDKTARVWELSSGKEQIRLEGHTKWVNSVAFSPDGRQVLTGSWDKTARVWELSSGKEQIRLEGHAGEVNSVAFSPDGKQILTGSIDRTARLWELSSGKELTRFKGHRYKVNTVTFSPDGKQVLTGSVDRTARLWDLSSGKELTKFQSHTDWVSSVAISLDGHIAITCDNKGWVFFWRIDDLEAKDPFAVYVAYYPIVAVHWQDKTHVVLADNGGPRRFPYFYHLKLEGMG